MSIAKSVVQRAAKKSGLDLEEMGISVKDERFYREVLLKGRLGFGESYMKGYWDAEPLERFFYKLLRKVENRDFDWKYLLPLLISQSPQYLLWRLGNAQSVSRSKKVAEEHYDISNKLYGYMLDQRMQYTCGYWKDADNLDDAQRGKLDLVCNKLYLEPGMKVLELGGGFGGLAHHMAKHYGVEVVSYNISEQQVEYARNLNKDLPVEIVQDDYRAAKGVYDRVVSIGMLEHVGYKNYSSFMKLGYDRLKDDAIFLVHTIGRRTPAKHGEPWFNKYIFPGGMLPAISQVSAAAEPYFVIEDLHNFGHDYSLTLKAWWDNFDRHWDDLKDEYDETFYRMWKYYLKSTAASFEARNIQLWQFVFTKTPTKKYIPVR